MGINVGLRALYVMLRGTRDMIHKLCTILWFACLAWKQFRGHVMDQLKLQRSGISSELTLRLHFILIMLPVVLIDAPNFFFALVFKS